MSWETIGESFYGEVVKLPVGEIAEFFVSENEQISKTGRHSLLKTLGIPPSFFDLHDEGLQMDILHAQRSIVRERYQDIDLLKVDGVYEFAAPHSHLSVIDPSRALGVSVDDGWTLLREDLPRGVYRFVYRQEISETEKAYKPATFLHVPIFYTSHIVMELGLLRGICLNSMVESAKRTKMLWNVNSLEDGMLPSIISSIVPKVAIEASKSYARLIETSELSGLSLIEAQNILNGMLSEESPIMAKTLLVRSMKHLEDIEENRDVLGPVPKAITSSMDLINVLTYYAKELPSVTSEVKATGVIMELFKKNFSNALPEEFVAPSLAAIAA